MEVKGTLHSKQDTKQVSEKFSKREFIIKTDGQYPEHILCQVTNDKCNLLESVEVGTQLTAHVNLKGRLWTGNDGIEKCFNTIDVWKLDISKVEF